MRKIITTTFLTLDGVMQAPGGPGEDDDNGFKWGGWSFNYWDDVGSDVMTGFMNLPFDLLLGRRTNDIFAGYWPTKSGDPISDNFNRTAKYVVSRSPLTLEWHNSHLVTGDVVAELKKLKSQNGNDLWVHGSANLIQTLLEHGLIDKMHIWICPVTVGPIGKRLFEGGTQPQDLKLTNLVQTSKGVLIATYEPGGELKVGSFA